MANSKQAIKRARQADARTTANTARRSRVRTFVKKAEVAIESGNKQEIATTFQTAMKELHKAASKGIVNKATAGRKISRLAARIKAKQA